MSRIVKLSATPTVDTSINASGDSLGGLITFTLPGSNSVNGQIIIRSVAIVDQAKQSIAADVLFFDANPATTTFTTNIALDVADADMDKLAGAAQVTTWLAFADNSVGIANGVNLHVNLLAGTLYAHLVTRGTPTYAAATDVTLLLNVEIP